jgi:hypothetical protein
MWEYRMHYYGRRGWKTGVELAAQVGLDVAILVVAILVVVTGAAVTGRLGDLAVLWTVPALVAVSFLGFVFDYLPQGPQDSTER